MRRLRDPRAPRLLAFVSWIEQPWAKNGFETNGKFTPAPRVPERLCLLERRFEQRLRG